MSSRTDPVPGHRGGGPGTWASGHVGPVFFVILAIALVIVSRILAPFFSVLLLALVTAGLIVKPYQLLTRWLGGRRRLAAVLISIVMMLAVLAPMFVTVDAVSGEAVGFYQITTTQLSQRSLLDVLKSRKSQIELANRFLDPFGIHLTPEKIFRSLATVSVKLGGFFYRLGVSMAKGLVRLGFGFFFWLLSLYYLLVDGEKLDAWFIEALPIPRDQIRRVIRRFIDMAGSLVIGNGLAGLVQGLVGGLVFSLAGIPGPILWGVVMGILAFIPVVGISLIYIPTTLVLLLTGQTARAMEVLVPLALVATIVEYWLKPHLVGRRMQMHTLLVFFSLLGGLNAFGPVGLLVGPLMMTAFLTLVELYREYYKAPRKLPEGSL
ncbi:MAG: AI-2E family transporter [Acidobacteria bacterium]|nr:AI-2E family transporter [Acidobacteriota bacterium]